MNLRLGPGMYLEVGFGGALGGLLRFWMGGGEWSPSILPLLGINCAGSALIGLVWAFAEPGRRRRLPAPWALGLMAGLCGAMTSFSAAIVPVLATAHAAGPLPAVALLGGSAAAWLASFALAWVVGRWLNPRRAPASSDFRERRDKR